MEDRGVAGREWEGGHNCCLRLAWFVSWMGCESVILSASAHELSEWPGIDGEIGPHRLLE